MSRHLPEPVGFPQLVVTHKKALIVDAHRPGTVLLSLRKPKSESASEKVSCEMDDGPWKLEMEHGTVICSYDSGEHTGVWRAELLPSPGSCTLVLNSGFQAVPESNCHVDMWAVVLLLFVAIAGVGVVHWHCRIEIPNHVNRMEDKMHERFNYLENRFRWLQKVVMKQLWNSVKVMPPGTELRTNDGEFDFGPYRLRLRFPCVAQVVDNVTFETSWTKASSKLQPGGCVMTMQRDGNLVLYDGDNKPVWASRDEMGIMCPQGITVDAEGHWMCAPK